MQQQNYKLNTIEETTSVTFAGTCISKHYTHLFETFSAPEQ